MQNRILPLRHSMSLDRLPHMLLGRIPARRITTTSITNTRNRAEYSKVPPIPGRDLRGAINHKPEPKTS